ncbi:MAG: HNH endonuclease [Treponema sp.]|jgi:hypothetical protein|nr:HNH endonuclease [Treponema sp.]
MTIFSPEHKKFLEENVPGKPFSKVTQLFNSRFKTDFSKSQIRAFCQRNGIKNGLNLNWTPEMKNFVKKNFKKTKRIRDLTELASECFGIPFTRAQVSGFLLREGIRAGKKIFISKPLYCESEIKNRNGKIVKIMIKVAMTGDKKNKWQFKNRWVWEQSNGKIPAGMNIIFLDSNPRNCTLENLAMVSNVEKLKLDQLKLRSDNREITLTGIAIVKHLMALHGRLNKMLGPEEHKLFIGREYRRRIKARKKAMGLI